MEAKNNTVKGFIPVTIKNGKSSISYVNIDTITSVGDYGNGTVIEHSQEHWSTVEETVMDVLRLIESNRTNL